MINWQKDQQTTKFIKLGYIPFSIKKQNWQKLKKMLQQRINNKQIMQNDNITNQQQKSTQQQINTQLTCKLLKQSDLINVWNSVYKLKIYDNHGEVNDFQFQSQENLIMQVEFKWKKGECIQVINMQERGCLKICNPIMLQNKYKKNVKTMAWMTYNEDFFIQNQEDFALQAWVSESLLKKLTKNYQKFQQKINLSQEQGIQNKLVRQRLNFFSQSWKNKSITSQIQLLRVLSNIVTKQSLTISQQPKNKLECNIGLNPNQIYQKYDPQPLNRCITQEVNFKPQKDNNPVYSFNFTNQKGQAGLYFDIKSDSISQTPTPLQFNGKLKSYQGHALTWMLFRQGIGSICGMDIMHIPYWKDRGTQLNIKQKLLINTNLNFVVYNRNVEKKCKGGILADQMGLGKTIMVIALILANRPQKSQTLIIAPLSVIKQWEDQVKRFAPGLKVLVINQTKITRNKIVQSDVVITTQGKVKAQLKKQYNRYNILQHKWFRIVIDQAHNFKNSKTVMAKAIYELQAEYRWCLTGTPTQNSLGDLFSLVKFLRYTPWCWESWWDSKFPKDVKKTTAEHFMNIKSLLRGILLRRKKQSIDINGDNLINLPKIDVQVHIVHLSEQAKLAYQIVDNRAKNTLKNLQKLQHVLKFNKISKAKRISLNQLKRLKFHQILGLMVKMRMICCHEFLANYKQNFISYQQFIGEYIKFLAKNKVARLPKYNYFDYFLASAQEKQKFHKSPAITQLNRVYQNWDDRLRQISLGRIQQCLKCNELTEGVITPCLHIFCRRCIEEYITKKWMADSLAKRQEFQKYQVFADNKFKKINLKDFNGGCPQCGDKLKLSQIFDLPRLNEFNTPLQQYKYNEKIQALIKYLKQITHFEKALIYTSFIGMLRLLEQALRKENITCLTVQGTDCYEVRHKKIQQFNKNSRIQALIITLKTGSVGLNLQSANWVFFMDPWWNPAIEEQAIGRVHRIGQIKQVRAIKFITQSTIQARILKLSLTKKEMSDSILDIDDVVNDKRYSKTRSQIKFLLSVQQQYSESEEQPNQEKDPSSLKQEIQKVQQIIKETKIKWQIKQNHNIKYQANHKQNFQIDIQSVNSNQEEQASQNQQQQMGDI